MSERKSFEGRYDLVSVDERRWNVSLFRKRQRGQGQARALID